MDLLIAILAIVIPLVISSKKKSKTGQQKTTKPQMQQVFNQMQTSVRQQVQEVWHEQQNSTRQQTWNGQQSWAGQPQPRPQQQSWAGQPQGMWVQQELDLQQMDPQERMRQKKAELQKKYGAAKTSQPAAKSLQKNTSIVERAKLNNAKLAEDETLKEIESLHGHKEEHAPDKVQHDAACQTLKKDRDAVLAEESMLGSIEDLMVKGYSGDLNFDRDFLGEAMDMIASFTVPDTVPDMVPDAMAKYQNA